MLHGATNCHSSNYGDFIYANMVFNYLNRKNINVCLYQPSPYFCKYLPHYDNIHKFSISELDALVYLPGGYFGEGHNASFKENLIQFFRFLPVGIFAAFKNKPIAILAIGAGPITWKPFRVFIKYICQHAKLITTRDEESYRALKTLCPNNSSIMPSFDFIVTNSELKKKIYRKVNKGPTMLVHYNHSYEALKKFAYAVKLFSCNHPEFSFVVSSDQILNCDEAMYQQFLSLSKIKNCRFHKYDNPDEMTNLIGNSDAILTSKLHVGVVGAMLGKSVISVPCHPEKTKRFYQEIGETQRCISLYDSSVETINELLEKYYCKKIFISERNIKRANITVKLFDQFLQGLR